MFNRWRNLLGAQRRFERRPPTEAQSIAEPITEDLSSSQVRQLTTMEELDAVLKEVDAAHEISDDEMRKVFTTFRFKLSDEDLPPDPFSEAYRDYQFRLYRLISNRDYLVANEVTPWLDVSEHAARPFPYYTESYQTVSGHLFNLANIIRILALEPRAKILEFGPGHGNTTLAFAQMGYQVTAIDIEERYLKIIEKRCADLPQPPRLLCRDFCDIDDLDEQFDAVVFYESFHHCSHHQALIQKLAARLRPNGQIMFACEPIRADFPVPWGLRLDGESMWAIRRFGWLELGFRESYFFDLLSRNGLSLQRESAPSDDDGIYVARRSQLPS